MSETTDIDRLHDVASGKRFGRGCGKTYLECHKIVGAIETISDLQFVFIFVPSIRYRDHILPQLDTILAEHNKKLERDQADFRCQHVKIRFVSVSASRYFDMLLGINNAYFCVMDGDYSACFSQYNRLTELFHYYEN